MSPLILCRAHNQGIDFPRSPFGLSIAYRRRIFDDDITTARCRQSYSGRHGRCIAGDDGFAAAIEQQHVGRLSKNSCSSGLQTASLNSTCFIRCWGSPERCWEPGNPLNFANGVFSSCVAFTAKNQRIRTIQMPWLACSGVWVLTTVGPPCFKI